MATGLADNLKARQGMTSVEGIMSSLLVFGYGYTARHFVEAVKDEFTTFIGTTRRPQTKKSGLVDLLRFDGVDADPVLHQAVMEADAVLVSVPPDERGDLVLDAFSDLLAQNQNLRWLGYLSTVGVYGDHQGAWVDERTPLYPHSERSKRRVEAEQAWLDLGQQAGLPVHVFRLAGIYGPGQNALVNLQQGTAKRVIKEGQVFNRIHVEDIVAVLKASLQKPHAQAIYNVSDDEPSPPQDVVAYAAQKSGYPLPPEMPFEKANLSPMALSFYGENKRVSNALIKEALGVTLAYPTYRQGIDALYAAGEGR
jgi:nucleoside-diphosphate-sugar epimerase